VKLESMLWSGVTCYYMMLAVVYLLVGGSPGGVALLFAAAALGGLVAGWTWHWRRSHGPRPADRNEGSPIDQTGVVGVYPTASLRPFALAVGVTALVAGIALGSWLSMIGVALIASQVLLLVHDIDS